LIVSDAAHQLVEAIGLRITEPSLEHPPPRPHRHAGHQQGVIDGRWLTADLIVSSPFIPGMAKSVSSTS
jgi:hypothetical protein